MPRHPRETQSAGDFFLPDPAESAEASAQNVPLAARMRPRELSEYMGQEHLLAPGKLLRRAIEADRLSSVILYGPPGCGKTALGSLIATRTRAHVERVNAVAAGVEELRRAIEAARLRLASSGRRTILFIDEIHRFNKAQQDVLMPEVEQGSVILVGATTHNPFFSIVSPLLSRSLVAELRPLSEKDLAALLKRALSDPERGLGKMKLEVSEEALRFLAAAADGDARRALNGLELAAVTTPAGKEGAVRIGLAEAEESLQKRAVVYDGDEDAHYDTISAYIKSMRGSDPDASLYWLAKMLYAGEDPRLDRKSTRLNSSHNVPSRMPSSA